MCGQERMTRMADGLFVLGETLEELKSNLKKGPNKSKAQWFDI